METELCNQSTKLVGQKIGAARNRAPIIQRALVRRRTHLNRRLILVEVTTKGLIDHESAILGWRIASSNFYALEYCRMARPPVCGSCSEFQLANRTAGKNQPPPKRPPRSRRNLNGDRPSLEQRLLIKLGMNYFKYVTVSVNQSPYEVGKPLWRTGRDVNSFDKALDIHLDFNPVGYRFPAKPKFLPLGSKTL